MTVTLTSDELASPAVQKLFRAYAERLAELRAMNDHPSAEDFRNRLIGRIAEVKAFLELEAQDEPDSVGSVRGNTNPNIQRAW